MLGIYLSTLLAILPAQVDFDTEVVPILTKAGCNSGACHGAAAGRGDFRLSLFGSRPESDYEAMVRELEGRRANLVHPEQSLLVAKPTLLLTHEGGKRFDPDSWEAERLLAWLGEGAPRRVPRKLLSLTVETRSPNGGSGNEVELRRVPAQFPLTVWATFQDPASEEITREDVTRMAVVTSGDPESLAYLEPARDELESAGEPAGGGRASDPPASANASTRTGVFRVLRGGRHVATIRFLDRLETLMVTAPMGTEPVARSKELDRSPGNWIDREIDSTLHALRLPASPPADELSLLRRLTLHLTGRLPTEEEIVAYQSSPAESRYEARVESLLESAAAEDYWTSFLSGTLRLRAPGGDQQALAAIHGWLRDQWRRQVGWDETVRALLAAEGDSHEPGPAAFYRMTGDARSQAEYVSETLWGVRMRCANCHDHPLDRWTQDDYHGLAAIFARLESGQIVREKGAGEVIHPGTGEAARPRLPGSRDLDADEQGRRQLAEWSMSVDHPHFARAMVNRIWKSLMGRGLIEPVDDLRETNPPTHPGLLAELEAHFRADGYELRPLIRAIVLSEAYRRGEATELNRQDDRFHSHRRPTRLDPDVLADAVADVTGVWDLYGELPSGTRAVSLIDPHTPSEALDRLGRCPPTVSCDASSAATPGIATRLHLFNGALLNEKIAAPSGRLHRRLAEWTDSVAEAEVEELIEEFYRRALGRTPREDERAYWREEFDVADPAEMRAVAEDFLWSLLNCQEFVTNH